MQSSPPGAAAPPSSSTSTFAPHAPRPSRHLDSFRSGLLSTAPVSMAPPSHCGQGSARVSHPPINPHPAELSVALPLDCQPPATPSGPTAPSLPYDPYADVRDTALHGQFG